MRREGIVVPHFLFAGIDVGGDGDDGVHDIGECFCKDKGEWF
ncbi:MAG: hypothetical protein RL660_1696 [Bacteroidota bacterium]|jgi:hypothetical protein